MAYTKTNWLPRTGTNLNKFVRTAETASSVILSNVPDTVTQEGTPFSADNMNHMEQGIFDANAYGVCSNSAGNAAKTVDLPGFVLSTALHIRIKFTVTNSAVNPTLNIHNTGAKPIFYQGAAIAAGMLAAGTVYQFVYNGTQYEMVCASPTTPSSPGMMSAEDKTKLDGLVNDSYSYAHKAEYPAIPVEVNLSVRPPYLIHINQSAAPVVTPVEGVQGMVAWQVADHTDWFFGAWIDHESVDNLTRFGLFRYDSSNDSIEDVESIYVEGEGWTSSVWPIRYGITSTLTNTGTLSGMNILTDLTIPELPDMDVQDAVVRIEEKSTKALEKLSTETVRARLEEDKKVDKHATHANGSTDIANSPDNDGFSVITTQTDTGTNFRFETNSELGNPVIGGLVGRTAASASVGSRMLLFVHTGGGIRIHIRKDKNIPATEADLNDNDLILNKGEIDELINNIMGALSQGLKTPGVIDKESNLPAASGVPNGTYYVIQNLDTTAPGQQGRAWKNDALSTTDWQVVIDNVFAPDGTTIDLDAVGALKIADAYQTLIKGAVQGNQVEQSLPVTDDQDDAQKLISRRAAFGLVPKQQGVINAGKALIVGENGVVEPGFPDNTASLDENGKVPVAQLPIDSTPTEASTNPVSSGGTKTEIETRRKNWNKVTVTPSPGTIDAQWMRETMGITDSEIRIFGKLIFYENIKAATSVAVCDFLLHLYNSQEDSSLNFIPYNFSGISNSWKAGGYTWSITLNQNSITASYPGS